MAEMCSDKISRQNLWYSRQFDKNKVLVKTEMDLVLYTELYCQMENI